jgi:hypothetical protein
MVTNQRLCVRFRWRATLRKTYAHVQMRERARGAREGERGEGGEGREIRWRTAYRSGGAVPASVERSTLPRLRVPAAAAVFSPAMVAALCIHAAAAHVAVMTAAVAPRRVAVARPPASIHRRNDGHVFHPLGSEDYGNVAEHGQTHIDFALIQNSVYRTLRRLLDRAWQASWPVARGGVGAFAEFAEALRSTRQQLR